MRTSDHPGTRFADRSRLGAALVATLAAPGLLTGCTRWSEAYPTRSEEQVWVAMVSAARQPEYRDWHVIENDVWVDEAERRIEIHRLLRAHRDPAGQYPRLVNQTWTFTTSLHAEPPPEAPTVEFEIRGMHLPANGWAERDRYFEQVRKLLAAEPLLPPEEEGSPTPSTP